MEKRQNLLNPLNPLTIWLYFRGVVTHICQSL